LFLPGTVRWKKTAPVRQAFMETSPGSFNAVEYVNAQREVFDWLKSEAAPLSRGHTLTVHVSQEEMDEVNNHQCETCNHRAEAVRIGLTKPAGVNVAFRDLKSLNRTSDGGFVWTFEAESPGATALRVHLTNFNLPGNAVLYIYGINGEAFGPYSNRGPTDDGDFWTHTITGPIAYLQLRHFGPVSESDLRSINFSIADIGHIGPKFLLAFFQDLDTTPEVKEQALAHCSYNEPCVEDASCYSGTAVNNAKKAVAYMEWISGAWIYSCTGGLIADTDGSSQIPYFLTANHCISKGKDAKALELFWQYATSNCGGNCGDPGTFPRTLGADILDSSRNGDHTLMQLWQNPPSGSVFMGWTNAPVATADGTQLFRISHPSGAPQAYSRHIVDSQYIECGGLAIGEFIYSYDVDGATEGGSSGSPVYNMNGQIVGQLYGACGYTLEVCDAEQNRTVDGAFAFYFSSVEQWLDPGTSPGGDNMHVASIVLSTKSKGPKTDLTAKVTIVDANNNPVSGAAVTGTFTGYGSGSGTTGSNGEATIKINVASVVTSFQFCVTDVSLSGWTYDSGANVETCDTL
jgi:V8-like Glu-specific endopeptidase